MLYRVFAQFIWDIESPNCRFSGSWDDYEILVRSNSRENARKKVWNWARSKGAIQRQIQFVDEEMWKRDKCYKTTVIK